jgi:Protein of unknown function (DUF4238)
MTSEELLTKELSDAIQKFEQASIDKTVLEIERLPESDLMPLRIKVDSDPRGAGGLIKSEMVIGRGLWLFALKRLLTTTKKVLHEHRWTILRAPEDFCWVTSDNPVVRLNYRTSTEYNFRGGWGSNGTEIFLPLGPKHLMYTQIDHRPPPRGTFLPLLKAMEFQKLIMRHAYRFIFASIKEDNVPFIRPRVVDASAYSREKDEWKRWHEEQTNAERELLV